MDLVITLGREAVVEVPPNSMNWDTDEPSERGIDGIERMRDTVQVYSAGTKPSTPSTTCPLGPGRGWCRHHRKHTHTR